MTPMMTDVRSNVVGNNAVFQTQEWGSIPILGDTPHSTNESPWARCPTEHFPASVICKKSHFGLKKKKVL